MTETLRHFFVAKGIDRYFARMVTDVYGAGGVITTAVRAVHTTVGVAADAAIRRIRGQ